MRNTMPEPGKISAGTRWALLLAVLTILAVAACRSSKAPPDLGNLYDRAAKSHDPYRNPIVVIPGILGSKLTDPGSGRIVWGAFGGGGVKPQQAEGASLAALPMAEGVPLAQLRDDVVPDGVLEKMQFRLAGLPLELQAYTRILSTLGAGGYRDETFNPGDIDWGDEHFTCFQFDYDWRRDNVENAQRLHRFLLEKRAYVRRELRRRDGVEVEVRFDVVAHSMGGLLLRYLLRYGDADLPADGAPPELTWAGAGLVEKAVLIGPPNAGAVKALLNLVNGRKFGPLTPRYEAALLGTFPASYQLLPRARHGALVDERGEPLDVLDPELWIEQGWGLASPEQDRMLALLLPAAPAAARRRIALDHLRKSLARAASFHTALDRPAAPPAGTRLYLVAGDAVATSGRARYNPRAGRLEVIGTGPGDGQVLRSSALMDERLDGGWTPSLRTPIDWAHVTFLFNNHLGLTKDPEFTDNLLYLLLEAPSREP